MEVLHQSLFTQMQTKLVNDEKKRIVHAILVGTTRKCTQPLAW
jgi:hypothetical protein